MPLKDEALFVAVDLPDEAALLGLGPITLLLIILNKIIWKIK
jgi:hypothetical protein